MNMDSYAKKANPDNYYHFEYRVKCDIFLLTTIVFLSAIFSFIEFIYNHPLFIGDNVLLLTIVIISFYLFSLAAAHVMDFLENLM